MPFIFKKPIRKFTLHNPRINRGLTSVNCYGAKKILGTSYDIPGNILIPRDIPWNSYSQDLDSVGAASDLKLISG